MRKGSRRWSAIVVVVGVLSSCKRESPPEDCEHLVPQSVRKKYAFASVVDRSAGSPATVCELGADGRVVFRCGRPYADFEEYLRERMEYETRFLKKPLDQIVVMSSLPGIGTVAMGPGEVNVPHSKIGCLLEVTSKRPDLTQLATDLEQALR